MKAKGLFDAVAAPFQARSLSPQIVGSVARRCPAPRLSRIKAGLAHRPLMALEFILARLLLGLTVLRVGNQVRPSRRSPLTAILILKTGWRSNRFVLTHTGIPAVVGVIGVIVRNPAPPIGRVIIRQRCEIKS
jgi:hypothetical protein